MGLLADFIEDPKRFTEDHFTGVLSACAVAAGTVAAVVTGLGLPAFVVGAIAGAVGADVIISAAAAILAIPGALVENMTLRKHADDAVAAEKRPAPQISTTARLESPVAADFNSVSPVAVAPSSRPQEPNTSASAPSPKNG